MSTEERPSVLCVDDDPAVVGGLAVTLRRRYQVSTATSGPEALAELGRDGSYAVVISDMNMPVMDGAAFLARAAAVAPDALRILLTGGSSLDSAIAAVNEGRIFRFLTKPCPAHQLLAAVGLAVEQHRLITAERVLLEQTLQGSVKALIDVLALTNPVAFGRASRIKQHVTDLADLLGLRERWQVEMAAMLSQLGCIALPHDTLEKAYFGQPLSEAEQKMVARVPEVTEQLLANIPRLEAVREILRSWPKPFQRPAEGSGGAPEQAAQRRAQLLKLALDFDDLLGQGLATSLAIDTLRGRAGRYDPAVLDALAALHSAVAPRDDVRELPLSALREGMVFVDDVRLPTGALLIARGYKVTSGFLERLRNLRPGSIGEPLRVIVPGGKHR